MRNDPIEALWIRDSRDIALVAEMVEASWSLNTQRLSPARQLEPTHFYHYTNYSSLKAIVETGTLRLGAAENTNDPRETKERYFPALVSERTSGNRVENKAKDKEAHQLWDGAVRRNVKLGCFTVDRVPVSQLAGEESFHRGWGRPRMWSEYGEKHQGACLVFDGAALLEAILTQVRHGSEGILAGLIHYDDMPLLQDEKGGSRLFSRDAVLGPNGAEYIQQMFIRHYRDLLLSKATDWAAETELRIALRNDDPSWSIVDIRESLLAVHLGEASTTTQKGEITTLMEQHGMFDRDVNVVEWLGGAPSLNHFDRTRSRAEVASSPDWLRKA